MARLSKRREDATARQHLRRSSFLFFSAGTSRCVDVSYDDIENDNGSRLLNDATSSRVTVAVHTTLPLGRSSPPYLPGLPHLHVSKTASPTMPQAHWLSLSKTPFLARSSHCISATQSGLLIVYGGELKPRTPVDTGLGQETTPRGSLHAFDLSKSLLSQGWKLLTPDTKHAIASDADKAIPEPRVGAATVWHSDALYMWGGRGGKDMSPLDAYQAGVWKATINSSQDPQQSIQWERIAAGNEDEAPNSRSYHTAIVHGVSYARTYPNYITLTHDRIPCTCMPAVRLAVGSARYTRSTLRRSNGRLLLPLPSPVAAAPHWSQLPSPETRMSCCDTAVR